MIAAPHRSMDRITQRSLTLSPPIVLGSMALISTLVRTALAFRHHATSYWPDEWIYAGLSRSLADGRLTIHGDPAHFPAILQPVLAAPLWRFFPIETAYRLVQTENAVAASLVVVPVYLLARYVGLERWHGYMCAMYALVVPSLVWIPVTISDFIGYTLAVAAIAAAVRTIDRPSRTGQTVFLAFTMLATLARLQYFVIAAGYVVAALLIDRRQAFRRHAIAFAALAPVFLGAVVGSLGYYGFGRGSFSVSTLTWMPLQAYLLAGITGAIIVPGAVAGLVRPRQRSQRAFALVVSVVAVGLLAEVSVLAAQEGRFRERYLFVLLPLAAVSFFMYLKRGRPYGRIALVVAAALAAAAAYLPVTRYSKQAVLYDSESMIGVHWLQQHTSTTTAGLLIAIGITVGGGFGVLTGKRMVAALAVPTAIAISVAITIPTTQWDVRSHTARPDTVRWIDQAADHQPVTLIATPSSGNIPMLNALYWNPSITREVVLPPTMGTDNYSKTKLEIGRDGTLLNLPRYFLYNRQGTHATIEGATVVKRVDDLVLYRTTSRAARFVDVVKGQLSNGYLSPYTELMVWGPGRARQVEFTLSRPAETPKATLLMGKQGFSILPGQSARFACTAAQSPFTLVIRSLSEIPDQFNRPVVAKLTRLRAMSRVTSLGRPGCIRLSS